jgi:hypothetical protein
MLSGRLFFTLEIANSVAGVNIAEKCAYIQQRLTSFSFSCVTISATPVFLCNGYFSAMQLDKVACSILYTLLCEFCLRSSLAHFDAKFLDLPLSKPDRNSRIWDEILPPTGVIRVRLSACRNSTLIWKGWAVVADELVIIPSLWYSQPTDDIHEMILARG